MAASKAKGSKVTFSEGSTMYAELLKKHTINYERLQVQAEEFRRYHNPSPPVCKPKHKTVCISTTESISGSNPVVLSLDCEMCITENGQECTRVTLVNEFCDVVYESLVWPRAPVKDYVTRVSGITKELLSKGPTKSLKKVKKDLLLLIKKDTILIGHSIECDLNALKLKHNLLVDTSIAYPYGIAGKKNSLRMLALFHLKRTIQENEKGHDSAEDASACMDLMRLKVRGNNRQVRVRSNVSKGLPSHLGLLTQSKPPLTPSLISHGHQVSKQEENSGNSDCTHQVRETCNVSECPPSDSIVLTESVPPLNPLPLFHDNKIAEVEGNSDCTQVCETSKVSEHPPSDSTILTGSVPPVSLSPLFHDNQIAEVEGSSDCTQVREMSNVSEHTPSDSIMVKESSVLSPSLSIYLMAIMRAWPWGGLIQTAVESVRQLMFRTVPIINAIRSNPFSSSPSPHDQAGRTRKLYNNTSQPCFHQF